MWLTLVLLVQVAQGMKSVVGRREAMGTQLGGLAAATMLPANNAVATPELRKNFGKIGIGAWAWGDTLFWGYDSSRDEELRETFDYVSKRAGFLDTAEVYGFGRSEDLIGSFGKGSPLPIATKFAALPWRTSSSDVVKACEASLKRLDRNKIDLYQIHFPNGWSNAEYWDGLADCVDRGLVDQVGVSNYGVDAIKAVHSALAKRGVPLASNQIQYSLLYRYPEENGLKQVCKDLDVDILAYSPLGLGLLTNKFTRTNGKLPDGPRKGIVQTYLADDRFIALQGALDDLAEKHNCSPAAVALGWCQAKGTIPIAGARSLKQAKDNLACLDFTLSEREVDTLDSTARQLPWLGIKPPFADRDVFTGLKMFDS